MRLQRAGVMLAAIVCAVGLGTATRAAAPSDRATIGKPVADIPLKDLWTNKEVRLSQFQGKTVVLTFISYNCDVTWRYEKRLGSLVSTYGPKDVVFLAVRSNARDTVDGIKKYCEAKNLTMPLLNDQKNAMSDYFGATVTPTFYVIDSKGTLRYQGSYDDNGDETRASKKYLTEALTAILSGKEVTVPTTRAFG